MKSLPMKLLFNAERKRMWKDAKQVIERIDKAVDFSEIYLVGSTASKKKSPNDIDFVVVAKTKNKKSNIAWPIDLIIIPDNEDKKEYLSFFKKYMKKKYGSDSRPVKLK